MRDLPESRPRRRLLPALIAMTVALGTVGIAVPSFARSAEAAHAARAKHRPTPLEKRRAEVRRQAVRKPTLTLDSKFIRRAQATGSVLPFTIRLRRPYEGGPGDDVLQLAWDAGATPWPLAGTMPPAGPSSSRLDGAFSYDWDYSADTSGYSTLGTVETRIGGAIALTATGFPIAVRDATSPCTGLQSLDATAMTLTAAGMRFGTVNPFSGEVSGTVNLRTAIRTRPVPCAGPLPAGSDTALATTAAPDPPLPVAFTGKFRVSPGIASDGKIRFGILTISDVDTPQRTTFGLIHACTDAAAADCERKAFPVRTKFLNLTAEVLAGDNMPPPPAAP